DYFCGRCQKVRLRRDSPANLRIHSSRAIASFPWHFPCLAFEAEGIRENIHFEIEEFNSAFELYASKGSVSGSFGSDSNRTWKSGLSSDSLHGGNFIAGSNFGFLRRCGNANPTSACGKEKRDRSNVGPAFSHSSFGSGSCRCD